MGDLVELVDLVDLLNINRHGGRGARCELGAQLQSESLFYTCPGGWVGGHTVIIR